MGVSTESYRRAIGTFASILSNILLKKINGKRSRATREAFYGKIHTGLDVTVWVTWLALLTLISYSAPLCLYRALYTGFSGDRLLPLTLKKDLVLNPGHCLLSDQPFPFATAPLPFVDSLSLHPPPDLRFLLLLSGQVELNPGPVENDFLDDTQSQQAGRMEEKLNKLLEMMNDTRSQFVHKFQRLEDRINEQYEHLQGHFTRLQDVVSTLQASVQKTDAQLGHVKDDQIYLASRLRHLEDEIERQERYSRRSNMVLYGMAEEKAETYDRCTEKVIRLLNHYFPQKKWTDSDIDRAHRLGSPSATYSRPRPVIVKFHRWRDAMVIMKDHEAKKQMRTSDGIRVATDLTKQQRDTITQHQQEGKHAYYSKGKLIVTEASRRHEHINYNRDARPNPILLPTDEHPPLSALVPPQSLIRTYADAVEQSLNTAAGGSMQKGDADVASLTDGLAPERAAEEEQYQINTGRPHPFLLPSDQYPPLPAHVPPQSPTHACPGAVEQCQDAAAECSMQASDAEEASQTNDLAMERAAEEEQYQISTDNSWHAGAEKSDPAQHSTSLQASPPLPGFGRGTPANTPTGQTPSTTTNDSSGGRGRGKPRHADRSRSVVKSQRPASRVRTRNQQQKSALTPSSQATLPRDWNQKSPTRHTSTSASRSGNTRTK